MLDNNNNVISLNGIASAANSGCAMMRCRGSALLLAMLVMAAILTVSTATSTLVLNEIQQSLFLDHSIVAFYGAESGLERGLFEARKKDFDEVALNNLTADLPNQASYRLLAEGSEDIIYASLSPDDSFQLDLYDPNSLSALINPIRSIRLSWEGAGSWLEVKWTPWTTAGILDNPQGVYLSQVSSPVIIPLYNSSAYLYRMRLIARKAAVANLEITAYNLIDPVAACQPLTTCQVPIPGRVAIKAIGEYPAGSANASRQALSATMPIKSPLSGLYDYVLYSEAEIKKEN